MCKKFAIGNQLKCEKNQFKSERVFLWKKPNISVKSTLTHHNQSVHTHTHATHHIYKWFSEWIFFFCVAFGVFSTQKKKSTHNGPNPFCVHAMKTHTQHQQCSTINHKFACNQIHYFIEIDPCAACFPKGTFWPIGQFFCFDFFSIFRQFAFRILHTHAQPIDLCMCMCSSQCKFWSDLSLCWCATSKFTLFWLKRLRTICCV